MERESGGGGGGANIGITGYLTKNDYYIRVNQWQKEMFFF